MLSGPQDWSFGGGAKTSYVRSATPRRQSAKPQWDVGAGGQLLLKFFFSVCLAMSQFGNEPVEEIPVPGRG